MATQTWHYLSCHTATLDLLWDDVIREITRVVLDNPDGQTISLQVTYRPTGQVYSDTFTTSVNKDVSNLHIVFDILNTDGTRNPTPSIYIQAGCSY